jgi:hypothetical protein
MLTILCVRTQSGLLLTFSTLYRIWIRKYFQLFQHHIYEFVTLETFTPSAIVIKAMYGLAVTLPPIFKWNSLVGYSGFLKLILAALGNLSGPCLAHAPILIPLRSWMGSDLSSMRSGTALLDPVLPANGRRLFLFG